jgi:hypothetical protein
MPDLPMTVVQQFASTFCVANYLDDDIRSLDLREVTNFNEKWTGSGL